MKLDNHTLSTYWRASRRRGYPPNIGRWRRMIAARKSGCSMADIAERFGLKDRISAKRSHYRAKITIARLELEYSDDTR